jgi:hypothetical protein
VLVQIARGHMLRGPAAARRRRLWRPGDRRAARFWRPGPARGAGRPRELQQRVLHSLADGFGGIFDLFGTAPATIPALPSFEDTLAVEVHQRCVALGLVPGGTSIGHAEAQPDEDGASREAPASGTPGAGR